MTLCHACAPAAPSKFSLRWAHAQISPNANPNAFYTELVTAPYVNNAIISTHIYGPSVTHAATNFSGAGLNWRLSVSFGKKTLFVRSSLQAARPQHRSIMASSGCQ